MASSVDSLLATADALRETPVEVAAVCCLRTRNLNVRCTRCLDACKEDALVWDGREVHVDADACTGCLACTLACPTGALQNMGPDDAEVALQAQAQLEAGADGVCFGCEPLLQEAVQVADEGRVACVRCARQIDATLLISLAAFGARRVTIATSRCDGCPRVYEASELGPVIAVVDEVLGAYGRSLDVQVVAGLPRECRVDGPRGYDASRRGMLSQMKQGAQALVSTAVAQKTAAASAAGPSVYDLLRANGNETLPVFLPYRRRQLAEAIHLLGEPQDVMWDVPLWGYPVVDPARCIGCKMCVTFCPTGALRVVRLQAEEGGDEPADSYLAFRTERCLKCRTCQRVCFVHVIDYSSEVFAIDVATGREDILAHIDEVDR